MTAEIDDSTTTEEGWGEKRSKVVTWHDPGPTTMTGLWVSVSLKAVSSSAI